MAIAIGDAGVSAAMRIFVNVVRDTIDALTTLAGTAFGKVITVLGIVTVSVSSLVLALRALKLQALFNVILLGIAEIGSAAIALETTVLGLLGLIALNPIVIGLTAVVTSLTAVVWWMNKAKKEAEETLPSVTSLIDRLEKKNIIHKNKASNLKSGGHWFQSPPTTI